MSRDNQKKAWRESIHSEGMNNDNKEQRSPNEMESNSPYKRIQFRSRQHSCSSPGGLEGKPSLSLSPSRSKKDGIEPSHIAHKNRKRPRASPSKTLHSSRHTSDKKSSMEDRNSNASKGLDSDSGFFDTLFKSHMSAEKPGSFQRRYNKADHRKCSSTRLPYLGSDEENVEKHDCANRLESSDEDEEKKSEQQRRLKPRHENEGNLMDIVVAKMKMTAVSENCMKSNPCYSARSNHGNESKKTPKELNLSDNKLLNSTNKSQSTLENCKLRKKHGGIFKTLPEQISFPAEKRRKTKTINDEGKGGSFSSVICLGSSDDEERSAKKRSVKSKPGTKTAMSSDQNKPPTVVAEGSKRKSQAVPICIDLDSSEDEEMMQANQPNRASAVVPVSYPNRTDKSHSWKTIPPGPNEHTQIIKGNKAWYWCTFCNKGQGLWSAHTEKGHKSGNYCFVSQSGKLMGDGSNGSNEEKVTHSDEFKEQDCGTTIILQLDSSDDDDEYDELEAEVVPRNNRKHWASVRRVARKSAVAGRNMSSPSSTSGGKASQPKPNISSYISLLSDSDSDESDEDTKTSCQKEMLPENINTNMEENCPPSPPTRSLCAKQKVADDSYDPEERPHNFGSRRTDPEIVSLVAHHNLERELIDMIAAQICEDQEMAIASASCSSSEETKKEGILALVNENGIMKSTCTQSPSNVRHHLSIEDISAEGKISKRYDEETSEPFGKGKKTRQQNGGSNSLILSDMDNATPSRYNQALEVLVTAEKERLSSCSFPVVETADRIHVTDFFYHAMCQYRLDQITDVDTKGDNQKQSPKRVGDGCLQCVHCGAKTHAQEIKSFIYRFTKFQKHLFKCKGIPKCIRDALLHLRKFDEYHRKKNSQLAITKVMERVFARMVASEGSNEDIYIGADTVTTSQEPKAEENFLEIKVIEREKILSHDNYPTLSFTAWNEEKDHLYDFEAFVAPSCIPNSGNGAFLKLVRVREWKDRKLSKGIRNEIPCTRRPLVMKDKDGNEKNVFIGPDRIHDDSTTNFDHYFENNSLQFSSSDSGCGVLDIGCYGPFFDTDIKLEAHYTLKNFLFDFEPAGWSFGIGGKDEDDNLDMILDITNDETGETHLRAKENIPMHVNEVGHDPNLVYNVTPLETSSGSIHYYAHPKTPMVVGESIELLVNYGDTYEEVRERKGYGKLTHEGDDIDRQRVKSNQAERVMIEEQIYSQSLEEIYDLLIRLQGTFQSILRATDASILKEPISNNMTRRWTARFRMHWIETLLRKRCNALRRGYLRRSRGDDFLCTNIDMILDTMKFRSNCITPCLMKHEVAHQAFTKEILEENVFIASKKKALVQPLDPHLWCALSRRLVYKIAQELSFEYRIGNININDAIKKVYEMSKAVKMKIKEACTDQVHVWKLGFQECDNEIINEWHLKAVNNAPEHHTRPFLGDYKHHGGKNTDQQYNVRYVKIMKERPRSVTAKIDEEWYLLWNVVRVIHILVTKCFPAEEGDYSLSRLCDFVGVEVVDAEKALSAQMDDPYDTLRYVSAYADDGPKPKKSSKAQKHPTVARLKKRQRAVQFSVPKEKQTSEFLSGAHPNVARNRGNLTFWAEQSAGDRFPPGWIIHIHKRQMGKTGGGRHFDIYWFAPDGKKLRSMPEIKRFLMNYGEETAIEKLFSDR